MAEGPSTHSGCVSGHSRFSAPGVVWPDLTASPVVLIDFSEFGRRMRAEWRCRVRTFLCDRYGFSERIGLPSAASQGFKADPGEAVSGFSPANERSEAHAHGPFSKAES